MDDLVDFFDKHGEVPDSKNDSVEQKRFTSIYTGLARNITESERYGIRTTMDGYCSHLKYDKLLAKKFALFEHNFKHKNDQHIRFFGGHLTGVETVRFHTSDRNTWFTDILEIDETSLTADLHSLPTVRVDFKVSSDVFNISVMYLMHKFLNSDFLTKEEKDNTCVNLLLSLHYKFLTSLLFAWFKYPADEDSAKATYALLSLKFGLKKYGNWFELLRQRSLSALEFHRKTLVTFDDDIKTMLMLNDLQGRIRDILKNIYKTFMEVKAQKIKIGTSSQISLDIEGEQVVKDKARNLSIYIHYVKSVLPDQHSFVKQDLINIVVEAMRTMPENPFREVLVWVCINHQNSRSKDIDELIDKTMMHSFNYLSNNRTLMRATNDLIGLISTLKGVYMSSRTTEPEVLSIRNISDKIVREVKVSKNDTVISSLKTGLLLYIVLRAFTRHSYGG